jgi:mycofactocin precursor
MADTSQSVERTVVNAEPRPVPPAEPQASIEELVLEDELLVEDVSIDGMCGVY